MANGATDTVTEAITPTELPVRVSGWWILPISAIVWWAVGFLPWIVHEISQALGVQSASAEEIDAFTPIPLAAEDAVASLVTMSVIGGVLAGASARLARRRGGGAVAAVCGTSLALAAAGAGAWWQVNAADGADDAKADALLAIAVGGTVLGLVLGLLAALAPAPVRAAALALPVVLADGWLWGLLPGVAPAPQGTWWVFAVALGIALGLGVDRNPLQMLGWLPAAALVWVLQAVGPVLDAVSGYFAPGAAPLSIPAVLDAAWEPLRGTTFSTDQHDLGGWVVGLLLGVAVAGLRLTRGMDDGDEEEFDELRAFTPR
ncbi:hypothetical protein [Myceligenerans salitolerans]|uniref:ABC transporter permease n=1 Tax=Myceligenerans salitolerans TaxID=1230528 RepID=A0ABS3IA30_9MICO|nr:hypothetical protein [Myceligenerans salitolerans]MBO0609818.1 hypothetical protein [Myceligenerans salitolerans]